MCNDRRLLAKRRIAASVIEVVMGVDHERDLAPVDLRDRRFNFWGDWHHLVIDQDDAIFANRDRQIAGPGRLGLEQVDSLGELGGLDFNGRQFLRQSRGRDRAQKNGCRDHRQSSAFVTNKVLHFRRFPLVWPSTKSPVGSLPAASLHQGSRGLVDVWYSAAKCRSK